MQFKHQSNFWLDRLQRADEYHNNWSELFKCEKLEQYYEDFQHTIAATTLPVSKPYSVNLIFAAIQTKLANIILNNPEFEIHPRPAFSDWNQELAFEGATLKQDTLNTIIENPNQCFVETVKLAALDHFFRFSVIEVGLSIDWQNPNKLNPEIEVPLSESVFFNWVPADRFRVSVADSPFLRRCSWTGYYKYFYRDILEKVKEIDLPGLAGMGGESQFSPEYAGPTRIIHRAGMEQEEDEELQYLIRNNEVVKVLIGWDNRKQEKVMIHCDTGSVMWSEPADTIMLATYKAHYRLKGFYPIPPVWYWISPQNEVNEARQQMQNYRRRYKRKFAFLKGKVAPTELDKLASDVDGEMIEEKDRESIRAINNPEIGISISASLEVGYEDFNLVAANSQVKAGDRETATKTKAIALKETVRENMERINFDGFVCTVGRLALKVISERMTLPLVIKYTSDPGEDFMGEVQHHGPGYRQIYASQLDDGYDYLVKLNVKEASPAQTEEEMQKLVAFLSLTKQFPEIAMSPILIKEVAYKVGYRNIKVIQEMQKMALLSQMAMAANMQGMMGGGNNGAGNASGNAARNAIENRAPNPTNEINNQLNEQV